ncbi:MAG: hypothetical protein ABSF22_02575 [Bryobacteraceae bacterium]
MRQYHGIKQQVPNALLLFRLGDFYELFFDDAITAARELEITLTARNKEKGQPIPMCGVPYHASEGYIARLIQKGYRVAICDQMEEAGAGKKLVRREVTRIVTPGTAMNAGVLRSHENNYLAAVFADTTRAGVAHVDIFEKPADLWRFNPGISLTCMMNTLVEPAFSRSHTYFGRKRFKKECRVGHSPDHKIMD